MGISLFLAAVLTGCGKKAGTDVLSAINREEPYTATLPSVTTQIQSQKTNENRILIGTVTGVASSVNIRSEASTSGAIVGSAKPEEKFLVTEENAYEGWHRISYNGQDAFISADYLTVTEGTLDMLGNQNTGEPGDAGDSSQPSDTGETSNTGETQTD